MIIFITPSGVRALPTNRLPGAVASTIVSITLHVALILFGTWRGILSPQPAGERAAHVPTLGIEFLQAFVPPSGPLSKLTAEVPSIGDAATHRAAGTTVVVDLTVVELSITADRAVLLAALQERHGAFGVAEATRPRILTTILDLDGTRRTDEISSVDAFWSVKVNDETLRSSCGVSSSQLLYALFPTAVGDEVASAVEEAVRQRQIVGAVRVTAAAYDFEPGRNYSVHVPAESLRWRHELPPYAVAKSAVASDGRTRPR